MAEVLVMPNGDRLTGKPAVDREDGRLRFASDNFGLIDLPLGMARVEPDGPPELTKPDPGKARPPVYREGWGDNSILQSRVLFADDRAPKNEPVSWLEHWRHRVTGGIINQIGQVDVTSYLAYYEGLWHGHESEFRGQLDYMYARQYNPNGTSVNVGNRLKVEARLRHDLDESFFSETFYRYRRDFGQGIARRVTVAQGLGYRYLMTKEVHGAVVAGIAARTDNYLNIDRNDNAYRPFGYLGEELEWHLSDKVILRHDLSLNEKLRRPEALSIDGGVELEVLLTHRFGISFRYALNYDIDRELGVDRFQELYSMGVVFRF